MNRTVLLKLTMKMTNRSLSYIFCIIIFKDNFSIKLYDKYNFLPFCLFGRVYIFKQRSYYIKLGCPHVYLSIQNRSWSILTGLVSSCLHNSSGWWLYYRLKNDSIIIKFWPFVNFKESYSLVFIRLFCNKLKLDNRNTN